MHAQDALPWLLLLIFGFSLVLLISSVKYAEWAAPQVRDNGQWIRLVFYAGTTPLASLIQSSIHIAILHTNSALPVVFVIAIATFQGVGWIITSIIWTFCDASPGAPSSLCPQASMADGGRSISKGLSAFKDVLAWFITVMYFVTVGLNMLEVRHRERAGGKDADGFLELEEYHVRPYESRV